MQAIGEPASTRIKGCRVRTSTALRRMSELGFDFAGIHAIDSLDDHALSAVRSLVDVIVDEMLTIEPVLLTKVDAVAPVARALRKTGVRWLQLHRTWSVDGLDALLTALRSEPLNTKVIMLVDPEETPSRELTTEILDLVDFVILDHRQGGTGRLLDSRALHRTLDVIPIDRVFLAGGITPDNVASLVSSYRPYAVDAQSSLLGPSGDHDVDRLVAFATAVRRLGAEGGAPRAIR
ncbi:MULTISPECIES: phosphoribosylanthranilate isomerase [Amycolatopsis]|uniref:N-(5'-phosphoribosyl)anthranilate isomerase n=1 Tax=Amycolatopsis albidoflavus TaxID=102226 RepID=A0ABW5HUT7_9PSEU